MRREDRTRRKKDWRGSESRGGRGRVTRREDGDRPREKVTREMLWDEKETRREVLMEKARIKCKEDIKVRKKIITKNEMMNK